MPAAFAIYTSAAMPTDSATAASAAISKPIPGGLSLLFSSPSISRHADDHSHARSDDHGSSSYSSFPSSSFKSRDHLSPVSVFHPSTSSCSSSRSPPSFLAVKSRERLFNGFVRSALGSCLDYVPPLSPGYQEEGSVGDLGFDLDEGLSGAEAELDEVEKKMLDDAQSRHKIFHDELVVKAFHEAAKAHKEQMRASGDPYLKHCVETAVLLAKIGANSTVVSAGLLHDTIDDSFLDYEHLCGLFGPGVAGLVKGVSELSHLSKMARENDTASRTLEADRLHTMFLAMADARAVLIKLADRLHNMLTLHALPLPKQERFAKETLEIFVPLARRLGISSWKEELENVCFRVLEPERYAELAAELERGFDERVVNDAVGKLEKGLKDGGVEYCRLFGRHKSLYSIYSKMLKKSLSMDEIHDIHGLRLVVESEEDCYKALEIVHSLWPQIEGRFKDYISRPKDNGYKSLHTVVTTSSSHPLEIQIRTKEMHSQAEFGYAAHWRYKEGSCQHDFILHMVQWARWVVTWQCESLSLGSAGGREGCEFPFHKEDCPYEYRRRWSHEGPVFVIMLENDKMSVHEFPANSTVRDLLERVGAASSIWSPYGFPLKEELRPRVNHQPINDLTLKLNMGDVVDLTTNKSLTEFREEIQRMYDGGSMVSGSKGWGN
ncbi:hypothetical protein LUZ60_002838 [Juncus effusus]|nr:hypothetical protein LUZ60_002838 [Juncus effusus]